MCPVVVSRLPGSTGTETCTEYGERLFRKLVFDFRQTKLPICRTIAMQVGAADVDQVSARSARVTTTRLLLIPQSTHTLICHITKSHPRAMRPGDEDKGCQL